MSADDREVDLQVDEEHTRLLTYEHAHAAAAGRSELVRALAGRLAQLSAGPDDDECARGGSFLDAIEGPSTDLVVNQASLRAASMTLVDPVPQSLRDFLA